MGMWGMYSGVMANEKHDGANEKNLGSSGDPLLTHYSFIGLKFYVCIGKLPGVAGYFASF